MYVTINFQYVSVVATLLMEMQSNYIIPFYKFPVVD